MSQQAETESVEAELVRITRSKMDSISGGNGFSDWVTHTVPNYVSTHGNAVASA
jgi:hypothetical protein